MVKHFKLVADIVEPWISVQENNRNDCTGIQCNLIKYLSRSLNFTFEIIKEDQGPGFLMDNGSWTGMLNRFARQEIDFNASPFTIRYEPFVRNIVDFSHIYNSEESVVITTFDDSYDLLAFDLLSLLDKYTMISLVASLIVLSVIYISMADYLLISKQTFMHRLSTILYFLFGTILGKDCQINRYFKLSMANYFLQTTWLFSCLQFYLLISSDITAKFNVKKPRKQLNTLEELVDSKMTLVVPSSFMGFNNIKNNLLRRIIEKYDHDKTIMPISQIHSENKWIVDTSYGRSAIFLYEVPLKMMAIFHLNSLKPNTKFRFIEERYRNPVLLTIATSRKLPQKFRDQINMRVSQYYSTGILAQELRKTLSKSDPLFDYKMAVVNNFEPVTFYNLIGPIKLILIICSISLVIFVLEFGYCLLNKTKHFKKSQTIIFFSRF